ncbi:4'-phosphopantetheinyl transferase superfamily protein [Armatimonas sp.]|uniref:4'-phosphopantetheinyl transferase family protein n=1 Tax=Armatimonas sp. TaxID=1872638 RepID=UPI00286A4A1F|nr:4'-phosphopantetheinyl transferase superfamily protein [Armatimonas sp.]
MTQLEAPEGVTVWQVSLDTPPVSSYLSLDEQARAARFRFARDRQRYIACRSALRLLLGEALGIAPEAVALTYGPQGKPECTEFAFNVSHSDSLALIALGAEGVDIEKVRTDFDPHELGRRVFTASEFNQLRTHDDFFAIWTRKEAVIKAEGGGFSSPLLSRTVWPEPELWIAERYELVPLHPAPGYVAALARAKKSRQTLLSDGV